jgi:hypothetical protein
LTGSGWSGPPAKMRWRSRRPTGGRSLTPEAGNLRSAREAASVLVSYEGEGRRERLTKLCRSLLASGAPGSHPRLRVLHHGHRQRPRTVPERWPARRREDPRLGGRRGSPCCGAAHPNGGGGEHRHQGPALLQRALRQRVSSAPNVVNTMPEKTVRAFADHGDAERTVDAHIAPAEEFLAAAGTALVDLDRIHRRARARGAYGPSATPTTSLLESSRASLRSLQPRAKRLRRPAGGPSSLMLTRGCERRD